MIWLVLTTLCRHTFQFHSQSFCANSVWNNFLHLISECNFISSLCLVQVWSSLIHDHDICIYIRFYKCATAPNVFVPMIAILSNRESDHWELQRCYSIEPHLTEMLLFTVKLYDGKKQLQSQEIIERCRKKIAPLLSMTSIFFVILWINLSKYASYLTWVA